MATIIKFDVGVPQVIALKFDSGKNCTGKFGPQVAYTTTDERIFWLDETPASDVERELQRLGIRAGQPFELTKHKTSHGGHSFRVAPVHGGDSGGHNVPERGIPQAAQGPDRVLIAQLEKSVEMAQTARNRSLMPESAISEPPNRITPAAACMCAAMCAAVDSVMETQAYASR